MSEQEPLPRGTAIAAVAGSVASAVRLLATRRVRHPRENVRRRLRFADGTEGLVYRETVLDRPLAADPCVLVVTFRLRGVRGRGHTAFRWESWLNVPLFVGFEGFVSKLWLAHDDLGAYRGLYEWDGPESAEAYARALWRVLELVSVKGSIHYHVLAGVRRTEVLADARARVGAPGEWWRLTAA